MFWSGCFWLLLHSVILVFFITPTECRRLADVYWNSSNPIFDVSNTDHVLAVRLLDRLNIVCPLPDSRLSYEFSKLYAVSRDEYNTCTLGTSARLLGVCGNARQPSTISVVFRDFSPLPGAMEFRPGQSYYVTSTSDGLTEQGMDQRSGGLCMTKHMKLILEVQQSSSDEQRRAVSSSDHSPSPPSPIRDQPRTTPIMYLIHEDLSVQQQPFVKTTQDEEGGGCVSSRSDPVLILAGIFAVDFAWRRL